MHRRNHGHSCQPKNGCYRTEALNGLDVAACYNRSTRQRLPVAESAGLQMITGRESTKSDRLVSKVTNQTLQRSDLISRRESAKRLVAASAFPLAFDSASAAESTHVFKTAIGLNGFQSGSRKYKKNYPIWE